jgi:hypothetical protein
VEKMRETGTNRCLLLVNVRMGLLAAFKVRLRSSIDPELWQNIRTSAPTFENSEG